MRINKMRRRVSLLLFVACGATLAFCAHIILRANAAVLANNSEVATSSEVTYYLTVRNDGVDRLGIESSEDTRADVLSNSINVSDKIPQGMTFKRFLEIPEQNFSAVDNTNSACPGTVLQTSASNGWSDDNSSYYYKGLQYTKSTNTVTFIVNGLNAGCELTIGVVIETPNSVDNPDTDFVETRRDFYNTATIQEGSLRSNSNTLHLFMGNAAATRHNVSYAISGDAPESFENYATTQHEVGSQVEIANEPDYNGYSFSGWSSDSVEITDNSFTMPNQDVVITGSFTAKPKYNVSYEVSGDIPEEYITPRTKQYSAGDFIEISSDEFLNSDETYSFSGWQLADEAGIEAGDGYFIMPEHDVILTAVFETRKFALSYAYVGEVPSGATEQLPETSYHKAGEPITLAEKPSLANYTFVGWYEGDGFEMPADDTVIYGEWVSDYIIHGTLPQDGGMPENIPDSPNTFDSSRIITCFSFISFGASAALAVVVIASGRRGAKLKTLTLAGLCALLVANSVAYRSSAEGEIRAVYFTSQNLNYNNDEAGSWKITKSAKWESLDEATISFTIDTNRYVKTIHRDVIFVLDSSGSMEGDRIEQVKTDAKIAINSILADDPENRIALVDFDSYGSILSDFTTDYDSIAEKIDGLTADWATNYSSALDRAHDILENYEPTEDREVAIVFLTDGYPCFEVEKNVDSYNALKTDFPFAQINAIQYEMGTTIFDEVKEISDYQYWANMENLSEIILKASEIIYNYKEFSVVDYINNEYFILEDESTIKASRGTAMLSNADSGQAIAWNLDNNIKSGDSAELSFTVKLKSGDYGDDQLLPTNLGERILTNIDEHTESVSSTDTPILSYKYIVNYDTNTPTGCNIASIPSEKHRAFEVLDLDSKKPSCGGWILKGWFVVDDSTSWYGRDYLRMPQRQITLRAIWSKPSISISMEGEVAGSGGEATLASSTSLRGKLSQISGGAYSYSTPNTVINFIRRAETIPEDVVLTSANVISVYNSYPAYAWYSNGGIYYYSSAEKIYLNANCDDAFSNFSNLTDISGLADFDASKVVSMESIFRGAGDFDTQYLSTWNTENVDDINYAFISSKIDEVNGLSGWNVSNVKLMQNVFGYTSNLSDISGLTNWQTGNAEVMSYMFYQSNISDITPLAGWDVSSNIDFMNFLRNTKVTNLDALANWDVSSVAQRGYQYSFERQYPFKKSRMGIGGFMNMFAEIETLEDATGIESWYSKNSNLSQHTSSSADDSQLFYSIDAARQASGKTPTIYPSWY